MNAAEHQAEAGRELDRANVAELGAESNYHLAVAQVHATLATIPDPPEPEPPADPLWDAPLYLAAALIERLGIGQQGAQRERTIALLVADAFETNMAANLAVRALQEAKRTGKGVKAVEHAIATLGIDLATR